MYVIDTVKLGVPVDILENSSIVKITSKVTASAAPYIRQVVETGCSSLQESILLAIDFRQRPVTRDVFNQILSDFGLIKQTVESQMLTRPISTLLKPTVFTQAPFFNLGTMLGKLMKVRDDLARQHEEGPSFICEDGLLTHIIKNPKTDLALIISDYYSCQYVPFYMQKHLAKFKSVLQ